MNSNLSENVGSVDQQTLIPIDTSEPCVERIQCRQTFPIANIKHSISSDQELLLPICRHIKPIRLFQIFREISSRRPRCFFLSSKRYVGDNLIFDFPWGIFESEN